MGERRCIIKTFDGDVYVDVGLFTSRVARSKRMLAVLVEKKGSSDFSGAMAYLSMNSGRKPCQKYVAGCMYRLQDAGRI